MVPKMVAEETARKENDIGRVRCHFGRNERPVQDAAAAEVGSNMGDGVNASTFAGNAD